MGSGPTCSGQYCTLLFFGQVPGGRMQQASVPGALCRQFCRTHTSGWLGRLGLHLHTPLGREGQRRSCINLGQHRP